MIHFNNNNTKDKMSLKDNNQLLRSNSASTNISSPNPINPTQEEDDNQFKTLKVDSYTNIIDVFQFVRTQLNEIPDVAKTNVTQSSDSNPLSRYETSNNDGKHKHALLMSAIEQNNQEIFDTLMKNRVRIKSVVLFFCVVTHWQFCDKQG